MGAAGRGAGHEGDHRGGRRRRAPGWRRGGATPRCPSWVCPIESQSLKGLDSLLSMVQMPGGIPVGTLAIGKAGATNAALLAIAILATPDPALREKIKAFRTVQAAKIKQESAALSRPASLSARSGSLLAVPLRSNRGMITYVAHSHHRRRPVAGGAGPRCPCRRALRLRGHQHGHLLPPVVPQPAATGGSRRLLRVAGCGRAGRFPGVPPLRSAGRPIGLRTEGRSRPSLDRHPP